MGSDNTALGFLALGTNATGNGNIALGFEAGQTTIFADGGIMHSSPGL